MIIKKEITLLPESSGIKITLSLTNTSDKSKKPGIVVLNNTGEIRRFFWKGEEGVVCTEKGSKFNFSPFSGWCGFLKENGLSFL